MSAALVRPRRWLNGQSTRSHCSGTFAGGATARRPARRRPDPLPPGRLRLARAAAARRARRPARAARGRPDAARGARVGRGPERRQGVGRLRPEGRAGARARPAASARTSCSRASVPESPPGSASARTTCPTRSSTARSPASAPTGRTRRAPATTSTTSAGPGVLEDTAPGLPPLQPADLAAGALGAVVEVLAALLERERTGRGARLTISMTHGSHRLVSHRARRRPAAALPDGRARLLPDLRRPPTAAGSRSARSSRSSSSGSAR